MGIHNLRRQNWGNGLLEILLDELNLILQQIMIGQIGNALNFQLIGNVKEAPLPFGVERANCVINGVQLLVGCHSGF